MSSIDQLLQEVQQLPEDQQLTLAHRILMANEPPASDEVVRAWDAAIRDRVMRYDQGQSRTRPAGQVFSDLDRRLGP